MIWRGAILPEREGNPEETMVEIVNLRTARKRAERERETLAAAANRRAHGVPKAERKRDALRREREDRLLDQHRIDQGDDR